METGDSVFKIITVIVAIMLVGIIGVAVGLNLGPDDSDGGQDGGVEDETLEYSLTTNRFADGWGFELSFTAPESGWYQVYLGDVPLNDGRGDPIENSFTEDERVHIRYGYLSDISADEAESLLNVRFSANIDAVRV